ncbi:MAG: DEAD/DEAH box helicase [Nitriliruptoraceae bacterium]
MTKTFRDLAVHPALCDALEAKGISTPFPIQELTLPLALEGHDLIGQARTGTGKTLAFGLPLLQRLDPSTKATQALVIVPTRELCLQVYEDLKIGATMGLTSISVYGGVGYDEQIDALTTGVHIVVGTPGRLLDHLNRGNLDLSNVTQLVLDEADEMLDMGFLPDVERLVESCQGENRHTMLFSATMPTPIVKLARRYMDHPTFTRADDSHELDTVPTVEQHFFQVHRMDKPRLLARILQDQDRGGVYVFVRTKHMADRLVNELEDLQTPSIAIHGDLRQSTREKNLDRFREGKATVLVATEVAARGLDVHGVTHVVNYDCPDDEKMYLHRIGRTARAGESGKAITFAEFNEVDRLNVIRKKVGALDTEVVQAFSTSPLLAERFRLPEIRPWDHLTTEAQEREADRSASRRSGNGRKSGSSRDTATPRAGDRKRTTPGGGGGAKATEAEPTTEGATEPKTEHKTEHKTEPKTERAPDRPAEADRSGGRRREGRSDGRPKSGRSSEGRGGDRDASRDRRPREAQERSADTGDRSSERKDTTSTRSGGGATRTRTRTRERTQQDRAEQDRAKQDRARQKGSGSEGSAQGTSGAQREDTAQPKDPDQGSASSGRTRARARSRGGADSRSRGQSRGDDTPSREATETDRAESSGGDRSGGGGSSREGKRSGGSGDRQRRSRGGQGRSGGNRDDQGRGDRDQRSSGREHPSRESTPAVAARGEEARGEGQPQRARRIRVEHLP